jgi:hypothetical protein
MHRLLALLLVVLLLVPAMAGCGPSVSSKEMGTILYKIPHVQGADDPYELPKIITPSEEPDISKSLDEEHKKTDQGESEKEGEREKAIPDSTPDNTKAPQPTPARHRPE